MHRYPRWLLAVVCGLVDSGSLMLAGCGSSLGASLNQVVVLSHDEGWAVGDRGLLHYTSGTCRHSGGEKGSTS
jgi:hypothetical protein